MVHPQPAASAAQNCAAQRTPTPSPAPAYQHRIRDAVDDLQRPLMALQALEQLTHPVFNTPDDFSQVNREAFAHLLTVLVGEFTRAIAHVQTTITHQEG